MVNGTWATFQRIWSLVGAVLIHFESSANVQKKILDEKSREDLYKLRNSQLSLVVYLNFK